MWRALTLSLTVVLATDVVAQDLTSNQSAQMLNSDIVILGEDHDNPAHHLGQAELMRQIQPKAVVFEMLTPDMAEIVNARDRENMAALGETLGWEAAGWPDFAIYLPVFEAMGETVALGAAAPRDTVRRAFEEGAAAVFGADAARFGLTDPIPPAQLDTRRAMQFAAHCEAMPLEMMGGMVEAQRLRDAQFSAAALEAFDRFGPRVVVITGNGHARRDWGMPFVIAQAAPDVTVYSIGFADTPADASDPRYDLTLVTEPAQRDDPCAAFNN